MTLFTPNVGGLPLDKERHEIWQEARQATLEWAIEKVKAIKSPNPPSHPDYDKQAYYQGRADAIKAILEALKGG